MTNPVVCPSICVPPLLHGNWDKLPKMETSISFLGKWFRTSKLHFPVFLVVWGGHMLMMVFWPMICKWKFPLSASLLLLMNELRHTCCCISSLPPYSFLEHRCDVCTWREGHTPMSWDKAESLVGGYTKDQCCLINPALHTSELYVKEIKFYLV